MIDGDDVTTRPPMPSTPSPAAKNPAGRSDSISTVDGLRRQNLSRVLRLLHRFGGLSRAQITKLTGFSRTSVGILLSELVDLGLVTQEDAYRNDRVGRPSSQYRPSAAVIGVAVNTDVRGIHVGFVRLSGELVDSVYLPLAKSPTPQEAAGLVAEVVHARRLAHPHEHLAGIGAAIPGRVDASGRVVTWAPHLNWVDVPFADLLEEAAELPSRVGFDAHLGLATETMWGTARGVSDSVYLYGGPGGIGAAVVSDRALLVGSKGLSARIGHMTVEHDGVLCACGARGCLETVVRFADLERVLGDDLVSFHEIGAAVRRHPSAEVEAVLDRQAEYLCRALRTIVLAYDPDVILLGGFMAVLLEHRRAALEAAITAVTLAEVRQPAHLEQSQFASNLLLVGSGSLAFEALLSDPASRADAEDDRG
jgi:predicted NBD/HSP70 family sugar kinase